ncbi:ATP-binding protein [Streptomyces sp. NBC_01478]|uniref:ATP-binding protein n=1 Tax=Streptomyces sp. NBC_01478 TaxID=2903882 RepID=UPI002E35D6B5|nr:ATP-binding protein [Streptomyces sp. NBC_01478]
MPTPDWSMSYPMTPRSVRLARLHTRRRLTLWNWPGDIDDAVLVTSELVANAVRHGKVPGHEVWLRVAVDEEGNSALTIDVSDPVLEFPVVNQAPTGESGRGLLVVSGVSESVDWFLRGDIGKTVRARLATN